MARRIIAVDPGKSGGLVWNSDVDAVHSMKMPATLGDVVEAVEYMINEGCTEVYMELVGGFIGKIQPGSSMFKFGRGFGNLEGVFAALKLPVHLVRPQVWIKSHGLGVKGTMTTTDWKNKLKGKAQMLYPSHSITLATSDAFLIYDSAINKRI